MNHSSGKCLALMSRCNATRLAASPTLPLMVSVKSTLQVISKTDFGYYRREQDKDRQVWRTRASYSAGSFKGHARSAQCDRCTSQHDPFRYYVSTFRFRNSPPHLPFQFEPIDENRQQLVNAGAIPVLVSLLNSPDTDVQYYCTTALSNIAVDGTAVFLEP